MKIIKQSNKIPFLFLLILYLSIFSSIAQAATASTSSNTEGVYNWNSTYSSYSTIKTGTYKASIADTNSVEPRVLEKLDINYWEAVYLGDKEKAAQIKADWEEKEDIIIEYLLHLNLSVLILMLQNYH